MLHEIFDKMQVGNILEIEKIKKGDKEGFRVKLDMNREDGLVFHEYVVAPVNPQEDLEFVLTRFATGL